MSTAQPVISADSHVIEPHDLWVNGVEAKFRDQAPRLEHGPETDVLACPVADLPPVGLLAGCARGDDEVRREGRWDEDVFRGGYDPAARLADLERDGVDREVLFPTIAMQMYPIADTELQWAFFRAYNTWLAEAFCAADPDRFHGIAMINHETVDEAVAEIERARSLGLVGIMVPLFNGEDNAYHDPVYDPIWSTAVECGMPVNLHAATTRDKSKAWDKGTPTDSILGTVQIQRVLLDMILNGLFERHPRLMVVSAENDLGWAGNMLERADYWWRRSQRIRRDHTGPTLEREPSFYFKRNVRVTFMRDLTAVRSHDIIGDDVPMWGSDFPHHVSTWPNSKAVLDEHFGDTDPELRRKATSGNVSALYGI